MSFLNEIFSAVTASLEGTKKEVRGKRQRNSPGGASTGRSSEQQETSLNSTQISEVSELIQGGMNGLAQVVGTKLQQVNERLDKVEKVQAEEKDKVGKHTESIKALEDKFQQLSTSAGSAATQQTPQQHQSLPLELRCHAVIGGLGYDTPADTLIERAKQLLEEARIPVDSYYDIKALRSGPGSMCEVYFKEAGTLTKAKWAVSSLAKRLHGDKPAWLDAKKTKMELRPARMVHRACEVLQSFEDSKPDKVILTKNMVDKKILRSGVAIGASRYGKWVWTSAAEQLYTNEQRKHAEEWAFAA